MSHAGPMRRTPIPIVGKRKDGARFRSQRTGVAGLPISVPVALGTAARVVASTRRQNVRRTTTSHDRRDVTWSGFNWHSSNGKNRADRRDQWWASFRGTIIDHIRGRKFHGECTSLVDPFAVSRYRAAVRCNQTADDGQTEAQSTDTTRSGFRLLNERLEYRIECLWWDADSLVRDRYTNNVAVTTTSNDDP